MVDAVETDPFGKVDAIDVLDLASLEARAEKILGRGEFGYISEGSDDGHHAPQHHRFYRCTNAPARAPRSGEAGSKYDLYGSKTGITAVNCADRREHAGTSKR